MIDFEKALDLALDGNLAELEALLHSVADVNERTGSDRWNLLHLSLVPLTENAKPEVLQTLAQHGVDVNAVDSSGFRPIHYAARKNDADAIRCLLELGADPNAINEEGSTPLQLCLWGSSTSNAAVESLLEHGADPDIGINGSARKLVQNSAASDRDSILALMDKYKPHHA